MSSRDTGLVVLCCVLFLGVGFVIASMWSNGLLSTSTASWVQTVGTVAAVVGAWVLQDRGHSQTRQGAHRDRIDALAAITGQCMRTVNLMARLKRQGALTDGNLSYLRDEVEADRQLLMGVDVVALGSAEACGLVIKLRRNMSTCLRYIARMEAGERLTLSQVERLAAQLAKRRDEIAAVKRSTDAG